MNLIARLTLCAGLSGAACLALVPQARAFAGFPLIDRPPPEVAPDAGQGPNLASITARGLTRIALSDLKLSRQPGEAEYLAVTALLGLAHELDPKDEDILRLLIEATAQLGDRERVADLTRDLLRLDPGDTVAQLSLISANIARLQDVDARMRAYEQFLGPKGESIDPAVRSRLALDCALLLRERGDAGGFAERLRQATTLDSTNRDAAGMLLAFVTQRGDPPERRLEALILLLGSEPLDPATHLDLARELAGAGASKQALRFFNNHEEILKGYGMAPPADVAIERRIESWKVEGPGKIVSELSDGVLKPRRALEEQIAAVKKSGAKEDLAKLGSPTDIKLFPEMEELWVLAASAAGDDAGLRVSLGEMRETLRLMELAAENAQNRPKELTEDDAKNRVLRQQLSLTWHRLVAGAQIEEADAALMVLSQDPRASREVTQRLSGWLAIRKGEFAEGRAILGRQGENDPFAALGLAVAAELQGDRANAQLGYVEASRELAGTPVGAWAYTRAAVTLEKAPPPTVEGSALAAMADGVPRFFDDVCRSPRGQSSSTGIRPTDSLSGARAFESMNVALEADRGHPFDQARIRITLRNQAPIPLAIGPDRTLCSRLMLAPTIDIGPRKVNSTSPEVLSLERRLRLMPREDLTVRVWAEPGYNGLLQELSAGEMSRTRWRVMQGFRITDKGQTEPGPFGLVGETDLFVKLPYARVGESTTELGAAIEQAGDGDLAGLLGSVRWKLFRDEGEVERLKPDEKQALAAKLIERYGRAGPEARLLMLTMLPPGQFLRVLKAFDEAVTDIQEPDARVALVKLVTRAAEKDSKLIAGAANSADPRVLRTAEAMRRRLESNPRTYSRFSLLGQP